MSLVTADETSVRSVGRRVIARDSADISAQNKSTKRCQTGKPNYHGDINRGSLKSNLTNLYGEDIQKEIRTFENIRKKLGDYIDVYLGSYFFLSTMAVAALGNTFSDVLGIGTAFYVERIANKVGFSPPKLTPAQLDMPISRNFANLGRIIGVTIGCLLGMVPLLFFGHNEKEKDKEEPTASDSASIGNKKADAKLSNT